MNFVFPYKFEEITEPASDSRYYVNTSDKIMNQDERQILKFLKDLEKKINTDVRKIALENFDFLYFLSRFFY